MTLNAHVVVMTAGSLCAADREDPGATRVARRWCGSGALPFTVCRSLIPRGPMADRIVNDPEHLQRVVRQGLREIPYRPQLIDGVVTDTRLTIGAVPAVPGVTPPLS